MRLINIDTLEFEEYFDANIPPYAILSHRWSDDEITFADYRKGRRKLTKGFQKVLNFCEATKKYNAWLLNASARFRSQLGYVWIDTCCIDKRSSAELSEAINAMYKWYQKAEVCFAHLADVDSLQDGEEGNSGEQRYPSFQYSTWFTRGWTLQEMVAPEIVLFCSADWTIIGHKCSDYSPMCSNLPPSPHISKNLASICKIDPIHLDVLDPTNRPSAAQILSWASTRQTSRVEDAAYSLFGLLSINLPLLYGEGTNAFRRLMIEVINKTNDDSVFAHWHPLRFFNDELSDYRFANEVARALRPVEPSCVFQHGRVEIASNLIPLTRSGGDTAWLIPLNCGIRKDANWAGILALLVEECFDIPGSRFFRRLEVPSGQHKLAGYIVMMPGLDDGEWYNIPGPFWRTHTRFGLLWKSIRARSLALLVNGRFDRQTLILQDSEQLERRGKLVYHAGEQG